MAAVGYLREFRVPTDLVPITPGDTALGRVALGLYITGAGNIVIETADGNDRFLAVPANYTLNVGVKRVYATHEVDGSSRSTTATGIFAYTA